MTKELLIKFIEGCSSELEEAKIIAWISKCKENENYYIGLKNLLVSQNISHLQATTEELNQIRELTVNKRREGSSIKKLIFYKWSCGVACVLLLLSVSFNFIGTNIFLLDKEALNKVSSLSSIPENRKIVYYTVKGAKARLDLPDGSVVWLNSDSKITYPYKFEGDTREVYISGEALFDVVKNPDKPMIVNTNKDFKIKVYGTMFNVRSYDNDVNAVTTLYEGKIDLITHNVKGEETITSILPNEVYEINDATHYRPVLKNVTDITNEVAWKDGRIVFENTPLGDVIKSLERWHGTIFEIKDASILNYTITATFRSESIVQIMEMIKYCALIDYAIEGNTVVLNVRK